MSEIKQNKTKGSNVTPSKRLKFFNSPQRSAKIKDTIEQLKRFCFTKNNRLPTLEEKCAAISLILPLERDNNKK
jgi:hypothetical protein